MGATTWEELENYIKPFVKSWLIERGKHRATDEAMKAAARRDVPIFFFEGLTLLPQMDGLKL